MKEKDNTFKAIGILIGIWIPGVVLLIALTGEEISLSDILLCVFALAGLELLCFLAHKSANR